MTLYTVVNKECMISLLDIRNNRSFYNIILVCIFASQNSMDLGVSPFIRVYVYNKYQPGP